MTIDAVITANLDLLEIGPLEKLRSTYPSMRFLWFDLDGVHVGSAPSDAPGATHLWGWDEQSALAARLENSVVVAGAVATRSDCPTAESARVHPLIMWSASHVGKVPAELADESLVTVEFSGPLEMLADSRWLQQ